MWIDVGSSSDVAPGAAMTVEFDSGDIVVWRSTSGMLAACDARCPHQWAHLGSAGAVDGDELVCLSHFWRFDAEGNGTKLSAAGRRDEKSPVATFGVREVEGRIELDRPGDRGETTPAS